MPEFIYTMKDLRKVVPPKREILKGIWLSFFHGAKIGVLGLNGAGKSSLLRIMAGEDTEFDGEAFPAKTAKVGFLHQEPELDPESTLSPQELAQIAHSPRLASVSTARGVPELAGLGRGRPARRRGR